MNMRPFVVEFTGTPEAGKTTTIKEVVSILEHKYKCSVVRESAEILPPLIPKGSFNSNFWMRAKTVEELISSLYASNDIIIVDRGIVDSQFFGYKFFVEGGCTESEYNSYKSLIDNKVLIPDLLVHLKVSPEESIRRRGGEGRVVTVDWVKNYNKLFNDFLSEISVNMLSIDTTNTSHSKVVNLLTSLIISYYQDFYL